jgi:hypothetical protein
MTLTLELLPGIAAGGAMTATTKARHGWERWLVNLTISPAAKMAPF